MTLAADLADDLVELAPYVPPEDEAPAAPLREVAFRADAWLPQEDGILREMFAADATFEEIAERLDRGRAGIADRACKLGLRRNSARPWTELEDTFLLQRYGQVATAELAQQLGRSCSAVYARAGILELTEGTEPPWTVWEDWQLREGYRQALPVGQIAALIGRTMSAANSRASKLGIRHPHQPGDWSDEEMARALELAEEGHRYIEIIEMMVAEGFPRRSKNGFGQRIRILGYGRGWGRDWTPEEEELVRKVYAEGRSGAALARRLGRSRGSLKWKVEDLGLQGSHPNKAGWRIERCWTAEDEAILRAEYGRTPNDELARKLDRKWSAVRVRANHLGLQHGWIRAFTEDEDRAILIAWRRGVSIMDLCHALNRDPSVVGKRCRRVHGVSFNDPDRPARAPRTRIETRRHLTLQQILALEEPHQQTRRPLPPRVAARRRVPRFERLRERRQARQALRRSNQFQTGAQR